MLWCVLEGIREVQVNVLPPLLWTASTLAFCRQVLSKESLLRRWDSYLKYRPCRTVRYSVYSSFQSWNDNSRAPHFLPHSGTDNCLPFEHSATGVAPCPMPPCVFVSFPFFHSFLPFGTSDKRLETDVHCPRWQPIRQQAWFVFSTPLWCCRVCLGFSFQETASFIYFF